MNDLPWEDNLLERKVESDLKDLLKTLVAFANSVRPGHIATILIGERDDATLLGVSDPDNIQKKVRSECEKIYPPIIWRSKVYQQADKYGVRVEIEYSGDTPHFGGPAWIRTGSVTVEASEALFQKLIELRSGVVRELSLWVGKDVTVYGEPSSVPPMREPTMPLMRRRIFLHRWPTEDTIAKVCSVNNFWVTLERPQNAGKRSEPLDKVMLSFDDTRNQLRLIIYY
jgi:hypothetical protein